MKRRVTCHCGAVELSITPSEDLIEAARCDCSFCRRRGAATVSVSEEDLVVVKGQEALTLYQWNTQTAQHYFCRHCGIYTHHRRRSDPRTFGVNLGAIEGVTEEELRTVHWNDGINHPSDA